MLNLSEPGRVDSTDPASDNHSFVAGMILRARASALRYRRRRATAAMKRSLAT
jgi:hypothetical protein